jgi:hypothetical protein
MTSNTNGKGGALAPLGTSATNPFVDYGATVTARSTVGKILRFAKGDYVLGEEGREVKAGSLLAVNMAELAIGWVHWRDGKPVETTMGRVADRYVPPSRREMGDMDQALWDHDRHGRPRDPVVLTHYMLCMNDEGELLTFVTSSRGGFSAIGKLSKEFGLQLEQHPNEMPVISLASGSYEHADFGKIKYPMFPIVGWIPTSEFGVAAPGGKKKKLLLRRTLADELDDSLSDAFA